MNSRIGVGTLADFGGFCVGRVDAKRDTRWELLPLDGAGGFRRDIQDDSVDTGDLGDYAVGKLLDELIRKVAQSAVIASSLVTARMTIG